MGNVEIVDEMSLQIIFAKGMVGHRRVDGTLINIEVALHERKYGLQVLVQNSTSPNSKTDKKPMIPITINHIYRTFVLNITSHYLSYIKSPGV